MTRSSDWTGRVGEVWADEWRRTDRSFAELAPMLDASIERAARHGVRAIDIGCGAGATSHALAMARADVTVVGLDLSEPLLRIARTRADLPNLSYERGDACEVARDLSADLLVSRHGIMFFDDPVGAFAGLADAAQSGARMVFSCFAERVANRWAAEPIAALDGDRGGPTDDGPGPFAFADPDRVGALLKRAGWRPAPPQRIAYRYIAGAGDDPVADAVDFFARIGPAAPLLRDAPQDARETLRARLHAVCSARIDGGLVTFPAVAWIWSATRIDPGSRA